MYSVLKNLSEYTYSCIDKSITSYSFLLAFKIVKSLQCILKDNFARYNTFSLISSLMALLFKCGSRLLWVIVSSKMYLIDLSMKKKVKSDQYISGNQYFPPTNNFTRLKLTPTKSFYNVLQSNFLERVLNFSYLFHSQ